MNIETIRNNDALMVIYQKALAALLSIGPWLAHYLYFHGQVGRISFNVDYLDQAHGKLAVRRSTASGNQDMVFFRVENPLALRRHRINGKTIQRIMSTALLEGFAPTWLIVDGERIQMWQGVHRAGDESCLPLRVATPAQSGATLNPASILFRAP